jgi:hypothetical protein
MGKKKDTDPRKLIPVKNLRPMSPSPFSPRRLGPGSQTPPRKGNLQAHGTAPRRRTDYGPLGSGGTLMKKLIPILLLAGSTLLTGCGGSQEDFVFTNTGQVALAPIARNDVYTTAEDTALAVPLATGVLANDTLNALNVANVTVTFPNTTTQGGTVTLGANTGAFTYTPAVGFVGTDTFSYTLSNGFATSTATVTISVTAAQVQAGFFVDAVNGNDATGDFDTGAPFATIQAAVADAPTNSDIVIRPGNYTGAINLKDGQRLLGSGSVLAQGGDQRPELTGPVVLADGNTLDFLRIEGTAGNAIDGDDQTSGTITNCEIADTTNQGTAISLQSVNGDWTVEDNDIDNIAGIGVDFRAALGDEAVGRINGNTITDCVFPGLGFQVEDDGELTAQVNDNVLTGNSNGFTFEVISLDTGVVTLQIIGNQNDDSYVFSRGDETSAIRVENFADLESLNTGTVVVDLLPVTDIDDAGF